MIPADNNKFIEISSNDLETYEAIEDERNKYLSLLQNIKAVVVDTDAMEYGHDADCRYIKDLLKDIPDG